MREKAILPDIIWVKRPHFQMFLCGRKGHIINQVIKLDCFFPQEVGKNDFQTMCGKKDSIFQRICWEKAVFSNKLWAKERPCFCFCEKRPYIFERILQRLFGEKAQTHF